MPMTFSISTTTPLFTTSWTPTSTGQYAGTCIFLIVFAAMYRALLSVRFNFSDILLASFKRAGDDQMVMYAADDDTKRSHRRRPWRAGEAVLLGVVDVVIGAVSYLLMIAVMTMNVGYFLSVLGGIFVGSVAFGHFMAPRSAAH
ncbi:hypothetical protein DM02DRAFT_645064 [Periconia macrospinosa]|uniref:Copper transport protein n=1 Tax=Periconia macrospinosa TaxID=97972 RepID=A0A2V1DCN5_9PLEO|nr:hypothetical protein DM02DRAFT_645064 [Periconia macrospinosa]